MEIFGKITDAVGQGLNFMFDREIRVGVTGLSRGGKTAFITSLVNLMSNFGESGFGSKVPRFTAYDRMGISYGGVARPADLSTAAFPYRAAYDALTADPPRWPEPTVGVSEIRLELTFRNRDFLTFSDTSKLYMDIWDYPGEWLMDLMLLDLDYAAFSEKIRLRTLELAGVTDVTAWRAAGSRLDPDAPVNEAELHGAVAAYTAWLQRCREKGFAMVVPGRFVLPGNLAGAPILEFVPWIWDAPRKAGRESLYRVLEERYESYREQVVRKFYRDCFAKLDRQIILIDCLKSLMGGRETFMDVNDTFDTLLKNFSYGSSNFLTRLISPKIDRVMFAATKADTVVNEEQKNLLSLLSSMVRQSSQRARAGGSNCEFMVLSAIRAARTMLYRKDGRDYQVLATDYEDDGCYFPGSVPDRWTRENMEFFQKNYRMRELRPPKLSPGDVIPNLNMDVLLQWLIGDKLE